MKESVQDFIGSICSSCFSLQEVLVCTFADAVHHSETLEALPQEIWYVPIFKVLFLALASKSQCYGTFYHNGGEKLVVWLTIIVLTAVPAFTHYFNDESLSWAGSLPIGFLFLVINCDKALALIWCKLEPAAMTLNSWTLFE